MFKRFALSMTALFNVRAHARAIRRRLTDEVVRFDPSALQSAAKCGLFRRYIGGRLCNFCGAQFECQILSAIVTDRSVQLNLRDLCENRTFALSFDLSGVVYALHYSHGDKLQLGVNGTDKSYDLWFEPGGYRTSLVIVRWEDVLSSASSAAG